MTLRARRFIAPHATGGTLSALVLRKTSQFESRISAVKAVKNLWRRYVVWRRAEGVASVRQAEFVKKVAASDEDIVREATANRGAGWSSGA